MDAFFRDGGVVDLNQVKKQAKAFNIAESDAKNWIYDEYVKAENPRKMAEGGPTQKELEERRMLSATISLSISYLDELLI